MAFIAPQLYDDMKAAIEAADNAELPPGEWVMILLHPITAVTHAYEMNAPACKRWTRVVKEAADKEPEYMWELSRQCTVTTDTQAVHWNDKDVSVQTDVKLTQTWRYRNRAKTFTLESAKRDAVAFLESSGDMNLLWTLDVFLREPGPYDNNHQFRVRPDGVCVPLDSDNES